MRQFINLRVFVIFIVYVLLIISLQKLSGNSRKNKGLIRKAVHFITGLTVFILSYCIDKKLMLLLLACGSVFSLVTYKFRKINYIHTTSGKSLGTVFYPLGLLVSFSMLYDMPLFYFRTVLMILTLSDTAAWLAGIKNEKNLRFTILKDEKSILGSAAFAVSAYLIHLVLFPQSFPQIYLYSLLSVIAAVNFEIISARGSDNFSIPAGCSLFFILGEKYSLNAGGLILIVLITAAGSVMLYKKKKITRYGCIAVYFLGVYFFGMLGSSWSIPVVAFFLSSVLFTGINGAVNHKSENTNKRNIWQVFANIIFAVLSSFGFKITGNVIFIYFYITLIAAVTADTWASELGPVFSRKCFSIRELKFKDSGVSGGISLYGTLIAAAGSLMMSFLSYYLFFKKYDFCLTGVIAFSGFLAAFVDSLLGAYLEPVLLNIKIFNRIGTEDSVNPNDIVNVLSTLTAPVFFAFFRIIV
ncbi:MAG: DUF92 domain-containing protein [Spirochaetes bacterium]|nr:DUF92 domain-containing protein [Spirochaetota bacterium]